MKGRRFLVAYAGAFLTRGLSYREKLNGACLGSVELQSTRESEYTAWRACSFPFHWW